MTVFDQNTPAETEPNSAAATTTEVDAIVGEGKKYRSIEDAVKSIPAAQEHIKTLEQENKLQREQLAKMAGVEESVNKLLEAQTKAQDGDSQTSVEGTNLVQIVRQAVEDVRTEEQAVSNVQQVHNTLVEQYGEKAQEVVNNRAKELGLSVDHMKSLAELSPKAYLELFDQTPTEPKGTTQTDSSVNTRALGSGGQSGPEPGTKEYFSAMRKEDPSKYFSPTIQAQVMAAAEANPEKFFGVQNKQE